MSEPQRTVAHPFQPFANPDRARNCVRCGRMRDHRLHRLGDSETEGRAAALHLLTEAHILVHDALNVQIDGGEHTEHMVNALTALGRAEKELEP